MKNDRFKANKWFFIGNKWGQIRFILRNKKLGLSPIFGLKKVKIPIK
jgi:hypothetical protein